MSVRSENNAPPHYRRYGGRGGGGGGSAFHSGKSYKKVSSNAQGGQARVNVSNPNVGLGSLNSSTGGRASPNGAHFQQASRGTPVSSSTGAAIKPTDVSVQKSTPGLPKAAQKNMVPLSSGTTGPSTPVKGPDDASMAFSLQFGSISPGVINGMQVPARTSSAPPNLDEQKQAQAHSDSLKATSFQNPVVPKQHLPRKDLGPVDQPSKARAISKKKNDRLSSPPGPVAAHAQKPTGPPIHIPYGGPNSPLQSQNSANTSLPVPLPMHIPVGNPPPHVLPHVFFPGYQHHQGNIGYFGMGLGSQYQQPMSNLNFGGARMGKTTHSDTHEELRLNKRTDGYLNGGSSGQKSHPPQSQSFLPAVHPITSYPGSKPLTNAQTTPGFQPPRFYNQASKQVTVKQSHKDSDTIGEQFENLTSASSATAVAEVAKLSTVSKSGPKPLTNAQTTPGYQPPRLYNQASKQVTVKQSHKDSDTTDEQFENLTGTSSATAVAEVAKLSISSKSGSFKEEQKHPANNAQSILVDKIRGQSPSVSSSSVGVQDTPMPLTFSVGISKDVSETSNKVEGLSNVGDLCASKCDNDEEGLKSTQIIGTLKVGVEVPIAEIEGSKQVKEAVEPSQDNTVRDVTVPPLKEHVKDIDGNSSVANVDVLSAETSLLNLVFSHDDSKEDTIRKCDVDQVNCRESVSVSVPEVSPLTLEVEATDLISSSSSSSSKVKGITAAKGKKKLKEIMKNADARGTITDLYNAYKRPEEKKETSAEIVENLNPSVNHASRESNALSSVEKYDGPTKFEPDDWEDAADLSISKIDVGLKVKHHSEDENDEMTKKYSRDFLLKFSDRCTDLPEGFEITPDITLVLAVAVANMARGPYPSLGKGGSDRPVMSSRLDRRPSNVGLEMGYLARGNHGVLRTPRSQPSGQYAGGILSVPMQPTGLQLQRINSDLDRWQRATGYQKGLMPSPHTPNPVMHKAEKKYEVGKVADEEQAKQRRLKSILNRLTPQNFEKLFDQVKQVNIDNAGTLSGVIGQIFDKALMEPTFVEMYANFCSCLAVELPGFGDDNEKITFKRLLLNKCQEEFERGEREEEEANRTEEESEVKQTNEEREEKRVKARRRMLGNIRLIGELYKKRMLTERIMHECIKKLLGFDQKNPDPDEEDIEALCKLMSTIGEMIDHLKSKNHMDAYFDMMFQLSNNMKLSSRVRFMLKDAIDLRKNKWQQRRKVEGPKKIEEVHRDAAQERLDQSNRLARGATTPNPSLRRGGQPMDFGPKGSTGILSSSTQVGGGYHALPQQQLRFYGTQVSRFDSFDNRTLSVPLRPMGDEAITLGPQGGLARGMSVRGPSNGYGSLSRDGLASRYMSERFSPHPANIQEHNMNYGNKDSRNIGRGGFDHVPPSVQARVSTPSQNDSSDKNLSEDRLHDMSIQAIKEFYSVRDEKEVVLCIKDLNAPGFHPSMISIWVIDSFERKDTDRELLSKLLISLTKSQEGILSQDSLVRGLESVLSTLEDAVNDAPKAAEFLGRMLARILLENVIPYNDVWRLIYEGGEKQGRLVEIGLAAEVVGVILEIIKIEKGDTFLNDMRASSNLRTEAFRSQKTSRLDMFI